jgi:hypothetical protein
VRVSLGQPSFYAEAVADVQVRNRAPGQARIEKPGPVQPAASKHGESGLSLGAADEFSDCAARKSHHHSDPFAGVFGRGGVDMSLRSRQANLLIFGASWRRQLASCPSRKRRGVPSGDLRRLVWSTPSPSAERVVKAALPARQASAV